MSLPPARLVAPAAVAVVLGFVYLPLLRYSAGEWLKPDYSHGFLVPLFAGYLAWTRRHLAPGGDTRTDARGLGLIAAGAALYVLAGLSNYAKEWGQGASLVVNLCGTALLLGGPPALRWLAPPFLFLLLMFPLPYAVEHALGWPLQKAAATGAAVVLQTAGYPTDREGVILYVMDHALEVERACNGLSMLLTFVALSAGVASVVRRPWPDRLLILLAAAPIAVLANVLRIAATGVLYNEGGKELGDRLFHDLAGWVMMPLALGLLAAGLRLFDWVVVPDPGRATPEDVLRTARPPSPSGLPR